MAKRRISASNGAAWAIVVIAIIALALYGYNEYYRPAAVVYEDIYETATISFSDARSGAVINPAVTLTGTTVAYGPIKVTASGGAAVWSAVPRGDYKVESELTGYYDDEVTGYTIESTTVTFSGNLTKDNIGTFSWGDTSATGEAPSLDENNQTVTVRLYLNNTADDTVIKSLRVKLVANIGEHENIDIDKIECLSHSFEEDDATAEKWIISGSVIGDIEETTVTVTYRLTLDVGAAADALVLTASVQDLDGDSPQVSASKTITLTAA